MSKATMAKVALAAGVSTGTVWNVVNGYGNVANELISRVRRALKQTRYEIRARTKSRHLPYHRQSRGEVGILFLRNVSTSVVHPDSIFYLNCVGNALNKQGLDFFVCGFATHTSYPLLAAQRRVDGLIIVNLRDGGDDMTAVSKYEEFSSIPKVWINERPSLASGDISRIDIGRVSQLIVGNLLSSGHKCVLFSIKIQTAVSPRIFVHS